MGARQGQKRRWLGYPAAIAIVAVMTVGSHLLFGRGSPTDAVMLYLLGVVLVSVRFGFGASLLGAILSVLAFDFFFIPPYLTFAVDDLRHIATFLVMLVVAVVISGLIERMEQTRLSVEHEQLRSSLLSTVSHDLRTPLAAITGAATTLLEQPDALDAATRRDLLVTIQEEAERLDRLVRNVLDLTRLESGAVAVRKEWQPLEEVVGAALRRVEARSADCAIEVVLPHDLPQVPIDAVLVEQLLVNLLENALKHTPPGSGLALRAAPTDGGVLVEVADRGPGIPPGEEERIFEKFHRAVRGAGPPGAGLGLAICRAIAVAHGGRIWAENQPGGGARLRCFLPVEGRPPALEAVEPAEEASA